MTAAIPDDQLVTLRAALADRYRVDRELGRGGMATVYLADDLELPRSVAIKVLRPDLQAALGPARFLREIEIAARLAHPNILPVLQSGRAAGLLYYVMPYVAGESLRERLRRERQLPIGDAIRIACEVADALQTAHDQGVVHRDVKPANILLAAGHAVVSDFGIAHAITEAGGETLTSSGLAIGTPGYMSPEQACGETNLDGRSDVYSLGCVLYEMLAGETPYTGPSAQAIMAKQMSLPVPPLLVARETVPPALEQVLRRALAKSPADRFQTAAAFARALSDVDLEPGSGTRPVPWGRLAGIAGAVAVAVAAWLVADRVTGGGTASAPDTAAYAVLPFDRQAGADSTLDELQRLHDALSRWSGLTLTDPLEVAGLLGQEPLTVDRARDVARRAGAGRYLRGTVAPVGDSARVQVTLYDAASGAALAAHAVRIGRSHADADDRFAELADRLLLRGWTPARGPALAGTRSLPARQASIRGHGAMDAWDLAAADSAFAAAASLDSSFAEAQLWLAVARAWSGAPAASWRVPAEQAALRRDSLAEGERVMSDAVLAEARGDFGRACPLWRALTERAPRDFTAWYGLAHCDRVDGAVLPDPASPSGWRFRTSYHEALLAYRRAFQVHPAILASFRSRSYDALRDYFMISGNVGRRGRALAPDTTAFVADPTWVGDSLALVPYPQRLALTTPPAAAQDAPRRLRGMLHEVVLGWVAASPRNPNAMEALAVSLAMLSDPAALDTLARARALTQTPTERFRIAATEVWMRLAFALPWSEPGLRRARALADSLLTAGAVAPDADPSLLAGLAALTGRGGLAARYLRAPGAVAALGVPPALRETAPPLLIYAALGGPGDSLDALEPRVRDGIDRAVAPERREGVRMGVLARAATLAFPTHRLEAVGSLRGHQDYLLDIQAAWATGGDTAAARRGIEAVREARRALRPEDLTLDALWPEAALLAEMGDPNGAASWLDPTLRALLQTDLKVLADPIRAASAVQAAALRARIAAQLGDRAGARRWATAVSILWSDADAFLQPIVGKMRQLMR